MITILREKLTQAPAGRATAIAGKAVHGLGGVGKTRLAVEYAWRHAADYTALLFVGAGSPADLRRNSRRSVIGTCSTCRTFGPEGRRLLRGVVTPIPGIQFPARGRLEARRGRFNLALEKLRLLEKNEVLKGAAVRDDDHRSGRIPRLR
jgi:pimeloyl-ACP methyl ester carboxylesterase